MAMEGKGPEGCIVKRAAKTFADTKFFEGFGNMAGDTGVIVSEEPNVEGEEDKN